MKEKCLLVIEKNVGLLVKKNNNKGLSEYANVLNIKDKCYYV